MKWNLEKRLIKNLKSYHKNPRKISREQIDHLRKSIDKFGMIDKPIITKENLIIGGHQRIMMLKKMGVKEIEVYVADEELSEKDIEELNIRLNKISGSWDWDILANQYEIRDLVEWGFSGEDFDFPNIEINDEEKKEDCGKCITCGRKIKAKNAKSTQKD